MNDFSNPMFGVDAQSGLKMLGGNAGIYLRLLGTYKNGTLYSDFVNAVNEGDPEKARIAGHTLKGAVGNLHLNELFEKSRDLEVGIKETGVLPTSEDMEELAKIQEATISTIETLTEAPSILDMYK